MIAKSCSGHTLESEISQFLGFLRSREGMEQTLLVAACSVQIVQEGKEWQGGLIC